MSGTAWDSARHSGTAGRTLAETGKNGTGWGSACHVKEASKHPRRATRWVVVHTV